jgi:hypothetical protein
MDLQHPADVTLFIIYLQMIKLKLTKHFGTNQLFPKYMINIS